MWRAARATCCATFAANRRAQIRYHGIDSSAAALDLARAKFPDGVFSEIDLARAPDERVAMLATDYAVINGLFTVKGPLSDDDMWSLLKHVIIRLWGVVRKGIAFNVMSKHVDSERADLFHVSFDELAEFLHPIAGRNIAFRADYSPRRIYVLRLQTTSAQSHGFSGAADNEVRFSLSGAARARCRN